MKLLFIILAVCLFSLTATAQQKHIDISTPDTTKQIRIVEVSCGECQFHLKGKSCDLAVRINGKAYFVDGADIDSFGDAHASDGFCKAISQAAVQGEIVKHRFKLSYIKLIKQAGK